MGIKDLIAKLRAKKEKYSEFAEDQRIQEKYFERKKSSNERELERFISEEREKHIQEELNKFRKAREHETRYGNQIIKVKNMFKGNGESLLKQRNLFSGQTHKSERSLFFKH